MIDLAHLPAPVDVFALGPGSIVFDRFCLISPVEHDPDGWQVTVTDLRRQLGAPPNHPLVLRFHRREDRSARRLYRALALPGSVGPDVCCLRIGTGGLTVVQTPHRGIPVRESVDTGVALKIGLALATWIDAQHAQGITGLRVRSDALRIDGEGAVLELAGLGWLLDEPRREEHDLTDLTALLRDLGVPIESSPRTADELAEHLQGLMGGRRAHPGDILPAVPPFTGRQDEIGTLMTAIRHARVARPRTFVITGGAGVGKSRMLRQTALELERFRDVLVLEGTFHADGSQRIAGLVRALADLPSAAALLPEDERDALRVRVAGLPMASVLAQLDRELSRWLGNPSPPPAVEIAEQFVRHASALASAIQAIGTRNRPLCLLLDEAELADEASVAVLHYLLTDPTPHHTLVVLACRDDGLAPLLEDGATEMALEPLSAGDTLDLLERSLPGPIGDEIVVAQSLAGAPLEVWTRLHQWVGLGLLIEQDGAWRLARRPEAASSVVDLFRIRLDGVPDDARHLLRLMALRMGPVTPNWLQQLTSWHAERGRGALNDLERRGLIVREPTGTLRLAHGSLGTLVADDPEIQATHIAIHAWLAATGASVAQTAWHAEHAGLSGLCELHLRAGDELLRIYELRRAAWHYQRALGHPATSAQRAAALEGRADAQLLQGRTRDALADYLTVLEDADAITAVGIAAKAAHALYRKADPEAVEILAQRALERAGEPVPRSIPATVGVVLWTALTGRLRASPHAPPMRDALARLYTVLVVINATRTVPAVEIFRGWWHGRGLHTTWSVVSASMMAAFLFNVGELSLLRFLRKRALTMLDDQRAIADSIDSAWGRGSVLHMRGQFLVTLGRYEAGQDSYAEGVRWFEQTGDLSVAVLSLMSRGIYGRQREKAQVLLDWLELAETTARRQENRAALPMIRALRLHVRQRAGEDVSASLAVLSRDVSGDGFVSLDLSLALAYLSMAWLRSGDAVQARAAIDRANAMLAQMPGVPDFLMDVHVANAEVLLEDEALDIAAVRKALKPLGSGSPRLRVAHAVLEARLLQRMGDFKGARKRASDLIAGNASGETVWLAEAHQLLAELKAGDDVLAAAEHRSVRRRLLKSMGHHVEQLPGRTPVPIAPMAVDPDPTPTPTPGTPEQVHLDVELQRLHNALREAMPSNIFLSLEPVPGVATRGARHEIQALLVHMVLAARDALSAEGSLVVQAGPVELDQSEASRHPGGVAGQHVLVSVQAIGELRDEPFPGVGACRNLALRTGGFFDLERDGRGLTLSAFLRPPLDALVQSRPGQRAYVCTRDPRVRSTLLASLTQLGWTATAVPAPPSEDVVCFVDASHPMAPGRVVVLPRSAPLPDHDAFLRYPVLLDELESVLRRYPNEAASQPG